MKGTLSKTETFPPLFLTIYIYIFHFHATTFFPPFLPSMFVILAFSYLNILMFNSPKIVYVQFDDQNII